MEFINKKAVLCIILCTFAFAAMCIVPNQYLSNSARALELPNANIDVLCSAQAACVVDADSGRLFFSKNMHTQLPMASTTKILTAITAILNYEDLDTRFLINTHSVGAEGSSIYIKPGEMLSLRELLYGLMLRSGNDAAIEIAYRVAGGIEPFADMMNNLAEKLELKKFSFYKSTRIR